MALTHIMYALVAFQPPKEKPIYLGWFDFDNTSIDYTLIIWSWFFLQILFVQEKTCML